MVSRARDSHTRRVRPAPSRWLLRLALLCAGVLLLAAAALLLLLHQRGIAPRALGPYVALRASGHNPAIEQFGQSLGQLLTRLDRGPASDGLAPLMPALTLGVQSRAASIAAAPAPAALREVLVASVDELRAAVVAAQPGDAITLLPGHYQVRGNIKLGRNGGTAGAPIVVRARVPGQVRIDLNAQEGFIVTQPWWRFENLDINGVCGEHSYCEHAFHVVGKASHFAAVNNRIADFNAHFKINGENGVFPDAGLIASNTLFNTAVRRTRNPVTPIDLVAASDWVVRGNVISDFVKGGGNRVSYGGFFKGGGARNRFDGNLVVCEQRLRGLPGQRVGLALGGGGTGHSFCRDRKCVTEQEDAVLSNNLIAACSDDGVYLNSAARSRIVHNTLVDTGGISVRFAASSADLHGNLVDGAVRGRDGGVVRSGASEDTATAWLYLGRHPVRALFRDSAQFDFGWQGEAPRVPAGATVAARDLCGAPRQAGARYGAFEDFSACLAR